MGGQQICLQIWKPWIEPNAIWTLQEYTAWKAAELSNSAEGQVEMEKGWQVGEGGGLLQEPKPGIWKEEWQ